MGNHSNTEHRFLISPELGSIYLNPHSPDGARFTARGSCSPLLRAPATWLACQECRSLRLALVCHRDWSHLVDDLSGIRSNTTLRAEVRTSSPEPEYDKK